MIDLDIKAFFDSMPWDLMQKAVAHHTDSKWVLIYVRRWLKAPMLMPEGTLKHRTMGTPQGGPISPLLANLFLHYGFDAWMTREYPGISFERYADDVIVHCASERQARHVRAAIDARLAQVGLELHPGKTKVAYCKDVSIRKSRERAGLWSARPFREAVPLMACWGGGFPPGGGGCAQACRSSGLAFQGRNRSRSGPRGDLPPLRPHSSR